MENIFAIYKEKGPTSNDIVQTIKKITRIKKVGHAGTLDPLAKGVLVVGIGRNATKKLGDIVKKEKEYLATIKFGEISSTDDQEGKKTKLKAGLKPTIKQINTIIKKWQGIVYQLPPQFSAVKIKGKEAYKLARAGERIKFKPRKIEIKKIKILSYKWPYLKINVITGPGAYIRSLARDIGEGLGAGAYLYNLERIRVGQYNKNKSLSLEEFKKLF